MSLPVAATLAPHSPMYPLPLFQRSIFAGMKNFQPKSPTFLRKLCSARRDPRKGPRSKGKMLSSIAHGDLQRRVHLVEAAGLQERDVLLTVLRRPALEVVNELGAAIVVFDADGEHVLVPLCDGHLDVFLAGLIPAGVDTCAGRRDGLSGNGDVYTTCTGRWSCRLRHWIS